jgi:hypothetical protein
MDMDKASAEEEKKRMMDKFFDYAETPIKEWVAEFLGKDPTDVFTDYNDDNELIGYKENDKFYDAYLVTMESNSQKQVPSNLLELENTRKACSMLFDAIKIVFPAVLQTTKPEFTNDLTGLYFTFDNDTVSFKWAMINIPLFKKRTAAQKRDQLLNMRASLKAEQVNYNTALANGKIDKPEDPEDPNDPHKIPQHLEQIDKLIADTEKLFDSISDEDIIAENARCVEMSKQLPSKTQLHIAIEERSEDIEQGLKRLTVVGLSQYEDETDESFSDKVKRIYKLND